MALVAVAALACGVGVTAYAAQLLQRTELQSLDARFSIRGARRPPSSIVLVAIDQPTLQELRNMHLASLFPFPRRYEAEIVDRLRRAGAKGIAFDLEFTHPSADEQEDLDLFEASARARGKVEMATVEVEPDGHTPILGGHLPEAGGHPASARFPIDPDGAIRRFEYSFRTLPSFGVVAAELALGHAVDRRALGSGTQPIDFVGPSGTIPRLSYWKVLTGRFPAAAVRGKVAIIGTTAPVLQDIHETATSKAMPGPEIQANVAATVLAGVPLRNASGLVDVLLILALGLAMPLGSLRVHRWRSLLDATALGVAFTVATQIAFDDGRIIAYVYPMLALVLSTLGTLLVLYVGEAIERERVRDVFSRFVPADLVEEVLAHADEDLRLGGVERDCTVLFSDLRGFTSFSETQPAAKVIEVVNHYLNEMTEAILAEGGTLIAYMGDGIMAVFGTPIEHEDHADRAVRAARAMVGERLGRFNEWIAEQGFGHRFEMGVGVNSGQVMAGNVGSERRVEYTAIGDTTNTASRLESMTKDSGVMVFISDTTRERLRAEAAALEPVGEVEIRGRHAKLAVWTLPGAHKRAPDPPAVEPAPEPAAGR